MRHCQAVVLALWVGSLAGCFTGQPDRSSLAHEAQRAFTGPTGDDVIQMEIVLLERPVGDRYVNRDVWDLADELSVEHRDLLNANGFLVGQVGGSLPDGLQGMLLSERCCVNPRHLELHAGTPRPILLGPAWTKCSFQLKQDDLLTPLELNQAQCLFEVVPTLTEDGKVRLHFTPQIRHGETTLVAEPVQHPSGERDWNLQKRQPVESYSWLGWDLTLSPSEYALVGTRFERGGTLGHRCFVNTDEDRPVQRLLVIRCGRSLPSPAVLVEASPKGTPSLALQASWSSARGTAP